MGDPLAQVIIVFMMLSFLVICLLKRRNLGRWATWDAERQRITVRINGTYQPDRIALLQGRPTVLIYERVEEDPCSEWLLIPDLGLKRHLEQGVTEVEILPQEPGEYLFTCSMGMYIGKIVVVPGSVLWRFVAAVRSIGNKWLGRRDEGMKIR